MINNVLMTLGDFRFAVNTAAYDKLQKRTSYNWASLSVLRSMPSVQFTGIGDTTISLSGTIYPYFVGGKGLEQLPMLGRMAREGKAYLLTSGRGEIFGHFGITDIEEGHQNLDKDGLPKTIPFTINLIKEKD